MGGGRGRVVSSYVRLTGVPRQGRPSDFSLVGFRVEERKLRRKVYGFRAPREMAGRAERGVISTTWENENKP